MAEGPTPGIPDHARGKPPTVAAAVAAVRPRRLIFASTSYLVLEDVRHAPRGFLEWAQERGASLREEPEAEEFESDRFSQEWRTG